MKKIILFYILILPLANTVWGQCTLNNINTNPDPTYVQPAITSGYEYKTNTFNWWNEGFNQIGPINTNITGFPSAPSNYITSPYYTSTLDYLAELVNNRDYESLPQHGWELIKQDMGYFIYDNPSPTTDLFGSTNGSTTDNYTMTAIPYYIIYNKYSGILRVFFLRNDAMSSYATVAVTLSFSGTTISGGDANASGLFGTYNTYKSSILNTDILTNISQSLYPGWTTGSVMPSTAFAGVLQPLDQKANAQSAVSIAVCPTSPTHWTYADFQMSYDPCNCFFESGIHAEFTAQVSGNITATGAAIGTAVTYNGTNSVLSNYNGAASPYSPAFLSSFYQGNDTGIASLIQEYNSASSIASANSSSGGSGGAATLTFLTALSKVISAGTLPSFSALLSLGMASAGSTPPTSDSTSGSATTGGGGSGGSSGSSGITQGISGATNLYNFFSWAGSVNGATKGASMLVSYQEAINGSVSISRSDADAQVDIANPGSLNADIAPQYTQMDVSQSGTPEYPEYNNTLGLFAALKSPTVNAFQVDLTGDETGEDHGGIVNGNHYEFQLSGLDYALNPIIDAPNTKIFAAIEYYIPMIGPDSVTSTDFPSWSQTTIANLTVVDQPYPSIKRFMTQSLPVECLSQLVSVIDFEPIPNNPTATSFETLSSVEAFIDLSVFYTFLPDAYGVTQHSFQKLKYPIKFNTSTTALFSSSSINLNSLPTDLEIPATTFTSSQEVYSYGTIDITGNISNTSGTPMIIKAAKAIDVEDGVIIGAGITLAIGQPGACDNLSPIAPQTPDASYCTSGTYKANELSLTGPKYVNKSVDSSQFTISSPFALTLYPNPTKGKCTVAFSLPQSDNCNISLIDVMGRNIKLIDNGRHTQGNSTIDFNTSDLADGVYMVRFSDGTNITTQKLTISK